MSAGIHTFDPLIVGLAGRAGTGKDTAADYLCNHYGFERFAFADPLRDMLETLLERLGIDHAWIFERALKERPMPGLGVSYRHMAQALGTEFGRAQMGSDFWLKCAKLALGLPHAPVHDRIVITDVRFANEAAWVKHHGGALIRLHREQAEAVRPHASEMEIDQLDAQVDLINNGPTPTGLHALLDGAMADFGVSPRES